MKCNEEEGERRCCCCACTCTCCSRVYFRSFCLQGTVKLAQLLYGSNSVELRKKKDYLKIAGKYFEVHLLSLVPLFYSNISVCLLLGFAFFQYLIDTNLTFACTDDKDVICFNVSDINNPIHINDCALFTDHDPVRCYHLTYSFKTAIGLFGGFLVVVPRIGFAISTRFYTNLFERNTCSFCFISFLNIILTLVAILGQLVVFIFGKDTIDKNNPRKEIRDPIIVVSFIVLIFLSCPFSLMNLVKIDKSEIKQHMNMNYGAIIQDNERERLLVRDNNV